MFQIIIGRREKFHKMVQEFKSNVDLICQKYEDCFEKQLETSFYQSLSAIDARLSSFQDTFEVLRIRLSSYSQELPKILANSKDPEQYCNNINTALKDCHSLKSSNLLQVLSRALQGIPSSSQIAEKFSLDSSIEEDLIKTMSNSIDILNEKMKMMQKNVESKDINPKTPQDKLQGEIKTVEGSDTTNLEQTNGKKSSTSAGETENKNKQSKDIVIVEKDSLEKDKKDTKKEESSEKLKPQIIWADPADESIEIFEREIAKFYQGDLIKRLAETIEKEAAAIEKNSEIKAETKGDSKLNVEVKGTVGDEKEQEVKATPKEKESSNDKAVVVEDSKENQPEATKSSKSKKKAKAKEREKQKEREKEVEVQKEKEYHSDENYISDEDEEELAMQKDLIHHLKNNVQPEMLRKLFKSRKHSKRYERHIRQGLVKFSTFIEENVWPMNGEEWEEKDEGSHSISVVTVVNKEMTKDGRYTTQHIVGTKTKDSKEIKITKSKKEIKESKGDRDLDREAIIASEAEKDTTTNFLSHLKMQLPDKDVLERLQKLVKKVKLTTAYKNKKLSPESIMAVQDFVGEFLRESHVKNVLEYRKKRRQFNDNEEAMKYNYVCRDFFIKYYHHYKNIKEMFLEVIGITKQAFNDDYKYWVDHDHSYLAWSRFKAKLQKAPLGESKKAIPVIELKGILNQLLYFIKDPLGEFREDIVRTKKTERYLLVELLMARVYDRAFFAFQIEEENILCSLKSTNEPGIKEAQKMYEEFETIIAGLMYPGMKVQVNCESEKKP